MNIVLLHKIIMPYNGIIIPLTTTMTTTTTCSGHELMSQSFNYYYVSPQKKQFHVKVVCCVWCVLTCECEISIYVQTSHRMRNEQESRYITSTSLTKKKKTKCRYTESDRARDSKSVWRGSLRAHTQIPSVRILQTFI